ncbi:hypothetical protein CVT24_012377 [Panaeolus cyanescens]|uniref:Uncharacterized protein n=1 Tax=Panaeolus cyanescens TaxID=181874 RepID=A0A409YYY5_9AGAR|nr:hypothetical protein CVT24_012377 [Panaeolus cyanescens]
MSSSPALPVGNRPFWDLDNAEKEEVRTISESCVLIQSLRQSREKWLLHTFPKFSSKTRGNKAVDVSSPPHTLQARGTCDLEIGPHIFPETTFYEVHYLPSQPQPQYSSVISNPAITRNPYWHTTTPYQTHTPAPSSAASTSREAENVSKPLISSLTSVTTITPTLISQVNSAASSNPTLSNLLQLAAGGRATPDQLKTLGLLIQSLASLDQSQTAASSQALPQPADSNVQSTQQVTPVKEFDIVLEFKEAPNERWTFPRAPAFIEQIQGEENFQDVQITTCVPFDVTPKPASPPEDTPHTRQHPVTFNLKRSSPLIWDTLNRWIGGATKMEEYRSHIQSMKPSDRLFLGYQIPEGTLLSQLQAASAPQFTLRPLRQGPAPPPRKRPAVQRKVATDGQSSNKRDKASRVNSGAEANKRSRTSRAALGSLIQCHSCNKTDVPLIMGGKFCRPCVNAGAAIQSVPQIPHTTYVPTTQLNTNLPDPSINGATVAPAPPTSNPEAASTV